MTKSSTENVSERDLEKSEHLMARPRHRTLDAEGNTTSQCPVTGSEMHLTVPYHHDHVPIIDGSSMACLLM